VHIHLGKKRGWVAAGREEREREKIFSCRGVCVCGECMGANDKDVSGVGSAKPLRPSSRTKAMHTAVSMRGIK